MIKREADLERGDATRSGVATYHLFVRLSDFLGSEWTRVGEWLEYMEQRI